MCKQCSISLGHGYVIHMMLKGTAAGWSTYRIGLVSACYMCHMNDLIIFTIRCPGPKQCHSI